MGVFTSFLLICGSLVYTFHAFSVYIRFNKVKVVNFTISAMIVAYTDQLALFILLLTTISEYILTKIFHCTPGIYQSLFRGPIFGPIPNRVELIEDRLIFSQFAGKISKKNIFNKMCCFYFD